MIVGSPSQPTDLMIHSTSGNFTETNVDLLDVFLEFSTTFYDFTMISLALLFMVIVNGRRRSWQAIINWKKMVPSLKKTIRFMVDDLVGQSSFDWTSTKSRLSWPFFLFANFIVVTLYALNLLSWRSSRACLAKSYRQSARRL